MEYGPYSIGLANTAGTVLAKVTHDSDGQTWDTVDAARVHLGTKIMGGTGRLFILDRDGDIVDEISGDGPKQLEAHARYDAYMEPERREKADRLRRERRERMEIRKLDALFAAS